MRFKCFVDNASVTIYRQVQQNKDIEGRLQKGWLRRLTAPAESNRSLHKGGIWFEFARTREN